MKILVVSVVHTPLDARIHHRQIRALRDAGIDVTQVGPWSSLPSEPPYGHENRPGEGAPISDQPDAPGRVPDGKTSRSAGRARGKLVAVDVTRAVGRRRLGALLHARRLLRRLGPDHDLILLHDPELVLATLGRLRRLPPVVLDVHEDLSASLRDRAWLPAPFRAVATAGTRRLERWAEDHLSGLLLAEEGYQARFRRSHVVVPNLPWLPREPAAQVDTHRVVYVGRLSTGRGARELVRIGARLAESGGPVLHLVGPCDRDVRDLLERAHDRGTVHWHGFLPNDVAMGLVRGSLAGLAPLHDLPNYAVSLPTKVAEYLANGVPAIVTPLPEAVRLVESSSAGVVVPFGDVERTVEQILALAADPDRRAAWGAAGRAHIAAEYSWDTAATRFVDHLAAIAGRDRAAGSAWAG